MTNEEIKSTIIAVESEFNRRVELPCEATPYLLMLKSLIKTLSASDQLEHINLAIYAKRLCDEKVDWCDWFRETEFDENDADNIGISIA